MGKYFGWRLFNVSENEEEEDDDEEDEDEGLDEEELEDMARLNRSSDRRFEGVPTCPRRGCRRQRRTRAAGRTPRGC